MQTSTLSLRVASILLALLLPLGGESTASVSMSPPRTRLCVGAGSHGRQTITIRSLTGTTVTCSLKLVDWTIQNGTAEGLRYHPANTQDYSCTPWVQVWPDVFELPPGGQQEISLSVALPADAEGSYFSAIILDVNSPTPKNENGFAASTKVNFGHLITVDTAERIQWSAVLDDFRVSRPDDTRGLEIRAVIRNIGNAALRPEGSLAIVDSHGILVGKLPMKTYFAQRGGTIRVAEVWEGLLEEGLYRAIGTIDLGGDQILTPELEFEVKDRLELTAVEVAQHDGRAEAEVRVRNLGNLTAILSTSVRLRTASGVPIGSFGAGTLTVLPGGTATKRVDLGILPSGRYELEVLAESEIYELETTKQFRVP